MRRFDFSLERILSLREYREKEWEIRLGEITGYCVRLRNEILKRVMRREEALRSRHAEGMEDLLYARSAEEYMYRMKVEQERLEGELEQAEVRRAEVQKSYLEASKEKKVLENLKTKREKEYYREQLKSEYRIVDEMNTGAVVRKRQPAAPEQVN